MNNKKNHLILCNFILLLLLPVSAISQTLQGAVQQTIDKNPEILEAGSVRLAVEEEISQARAGYFPTIDLSAGYGYEQSNNPTTRSGILSDGQSGTVEFAREEFSAQLRQMVFDGFATPSEVRRHSARTDSRAYTVFGQAEITALDATEAYLNVLRRIALIDLAKANLVVHQRTNDQIRLRAERGIGKKADSEQSLGRLSLAETNLRSEQGNLRDAETAFLRIVGNLPKTLLLPEDPAAKLPKNLDMAIEQALANHPILKSANADIDAAFAQHETAASPYYPRVDLEIGYSHNNNLDGIPGKNEDWQAMLRGRWNVFNGGKDIARRQETAHLIAQAKNIRDNTYRQVVESMRLSWVALQTVNSQMEFFKSHADASIKTNQAYQKQFNIGQRTLLDLLDSANEMHLANSAYTSAQFDELFAKFRIFTSKGELNSYLGVKLPDEVQPLAKN
jgi:adhesin transport system outer membrane protein